MISVAKDCVCVLSDVQHTVQIALEIHFSCKWFASSWIAWINGLACEGFRDGKKSQRKRVRADMREKVHRLKGERNTIDRKKVI